jgi:hypothetical protein
MPMEGRPVMSEKSNTFKDLAKEAAQHVASFADEMKLQMHLAAKDAQDAFAALAPQMKKVEKELDDLGEKGQEGLESAVGEETRLQFHLAAMEARDRWNEMQPDLMKITQHIAEAGKKATEALGLDEASLKARLAQMDAEDAIKARAEKFKAEFEALEKGANEKVADAIDKVTASVKEMRDKLKDSVGSPH